VLPRFNTSVLPTQLTLAPANPALELLLTHTAPTQFLLSFDLSSQTTNDDLDHRPTTLPNTIAMAPKKGSKTADSINAKLALTIKVRIAC
jgi:hypothetical protein